MSAGATTPAWSLSPSANQRQSDNFLNGVSCVSATTWCAAAGHFDADGVSQTLIESGKYGPGLRSSPNHGVGDNVLDGMSCASTTACAAVGHYDNGVVSQTLTEFWN